MPNAAYRVRVIQDRDFYEVDKLFQGEGFGEYPGRMDIKKAGLTYFDLVATDYSQKVIGCLFSYCGVHGGNIQYLIIEKNERGRGVGRALVCACLRRMRRCRMPHVTVISADNARGFYQKIGFHQPVHSSCMFIKYLL